MRHDDKPQNHDDVRLLIAAAQVGEGECSCSMQWSIAQPFITPVPYHRLAKRGIEEIMVRFHYTGRPTLLDGRLWARAAHI